MYELKRLHEVVEIVKINFEKAACRCSRMRCIQPRAAKAIRWNLETLFCTPHLDTVTFDADYN
jgi:hypothetical protein